MINHLNGISNWQFSKLKYLPIQIIDGDRSTRYPKRDELLDDGILFLNTTNIVDNKLNLVNANYITSEKFSSLGKGKLLPLDIVMTTRGSIGKVALFNLPQYSTGFINAQMLILRADGKIIDHNFLYYLLCGNKFQGQLKSYASGSAQPQIPIIDLQEISISYPPLPTQRKIAAILSAYDDLIENNTRRIKILEEMAQAIYREWFVHFRFPGHDGVKMVESELGLVPEGWEIGSLSDILNNIRKTTKPETLPPNLVYIPIDILPRQSLALMESRDISEAKSSLLLFKKHDILFGAMRSYFHKVVIAPIDGVTRSTCFVLRPIRKIDYSYAVMTCFDAKTVAYSHAHSRGSTMPYAVWGGSLSEMKIVIPSDKILEQFNRLVRPMLENIELNFFIQNNLIQTRDLLLPKLISGELDVSELEIEVSG